MGLYNSLYSEDYIVDLASKNIVESAFYENQDLLEECSIDIIEEGTNVEYTKILLDAKKKYKAHLKLAKTYAKQNEFNIALRNIDEAKKALQTAQKNIEKVDINVLGAIVGTSLMFIKSAIQDMISAALFSALGAGWTTAKELKLFTSFKGNVPKLGEVMKSIGNKDHITNAIKAASPAAKIQELKDKKNAGLKANLLGPDDQPAIFKAMNLFGAISSTIGTLQRLVDVYKRFSMAKTKEDKLKVLNLYKEAIDGTFSSMMSTLDATKNGILAKQDLIKKKIDAKTQQKEEKDKK